MAQRRASVNFGYYPPPNFSKQDDYIRMLWENDSPAAPAVHRRYSVLEAHPVREQPLYQQAPQEPGRFYNRFNNLNFKQKREKGEWTREAVTSKYSPDKTVELYDFPVEFETADLNQSLENYQHNKSTLGGYRIKWLNDNRALVVFRKPEIIPTVIADFGNNPLIKCKIYEFADSDLKDFNADPSKEIVKKTSFQENTIGGMHVDIEAIQRRYRPEHSLELSEFSHPMETNDLMEILSPYRQNGHIVRIKWFNKNRAIAWFSDPSMASKAKEDLQSVSLLKAKPYSFLPTDIKYFTQDIRISPLDNIDFRTKSLLNNSGIASVGRRNTVSGTAPSFIRRPRFSSLKNKELGFNNSQDL